MDTLLQLIVSGIAFGCIYALVAIEYSVIYKATRLVNFAHDKWIMLGAYFFAGTLVRGLGWAIIPSIIVSLIFMALFGVLVSTTIFKPLSHMPSDIYVVMGTVMLAKILGELARIIWGSTPFRLDGFLSGTIRFGNIALPFVNFVIILATVSFLIIQFILFQKTKLGRAMRCVASDKVAASLMGINVNQNVAITVAYSSLVCGVIGILVIPVFNVDVNMANMIGLKGFAAGVVGGFGTISGSIVGGIVVGLVENLYLMFGPAIYKDVVAFATMILFLLICPQGITAKRKG